MTKLFSYRESRLEEHISPVYRHEQVTTLFLFEALCAGIFEIPYVLLRTGKWNWPAMPWIDCFGGYQVFAFVQHAKEYLMDIL